MIRLPLVCANDRVNRHQTSIVTEAVQTLEKNDCLQSQDRIIMVMNVMYVKPDNYD